jgi:SAM-dependent methyltransferase
MNKETFFEIGCGTGFVLLGIEKTLPKFKLSASEIYISGLTYAQTRVRRCEFFQMDARQIAFENEFDLIGAFDVLEHIPEDEKVLSQIYEAVKPGGGIVLTVPQHKFLWSRVDENACHVRRYNAFELKEKVRKAGFSIIRSTSFVSFLLPVMALKRLRRKAMKEEYDEMGELRIGETLNSMLERVMDFELLLIRAGVSFPAGGSLLLIGQKPTGRPRDENSI